MTDVVLNSIATTITSPEARQFIVDAVRAGEGLLDDTYLQQKYELTAEDLANTTKNKTLIKAIRAESERRVRSGQAAREKAAKHFVRAPDVLAGILDDAAASPRHRIESARELRATAAAGADGGENTGNNADKFIITINLGADHVEHYELPRTPTKPSLPATELKVIEDGDPWQ